MKKNCPGKNGLSSFSDQLYENKTDPFAQRARMLWLSKIAIAHAFKVFVWRNVGPYDRKGERSTRSTLIAERKCMKRWCSGRLKESDSYTADNVSTYKRGLNWLTGNRHRDVTWPK